MENESKRTAQSPRRNPGGTAGKRQTSDVRSPSGQRASAGQQKAPSGQRKAPARAERETGAERPRQPREQSGARPREQAAGKRPAQQRTSSGRSAAGREREYEPYRAANQRKKARRRSGVRKFFSAENPVLLSSKSFFGRMRKNPGPEDALKKKKKNRFDTPAVVYTQPKPFRRDRLLLQLFIVLAVVLALVIGLSVFFKVKIIVVSGTEVYSPWTIREASGISEGDNLLTFSHARAAGKITANLPYVKTARIGIKLPDTVKIEIEEENVVYSVQATDGVWWLITSGGKVLEQTTDLRAKSYTQILGVSIMPPSAGNMAAVEDKPASTDESGETVPLTVTGTQQLNAALEIFQALEDNDIVGQVATVDVTRIDDIILWYGTQYQVNLGSSSQLSYKIACMNDVILQLSDYETGVLDISFTTWPDQVGYTPFE